MTPEDVLAWMDTQVDRLLPGTSVRWRATARRIKSDPELRRQYLIETQRGKGTGAIIRTTDGLTTHLMAIAANPGTPARHGNVQCHRHRR